MKVKNPWQRFKPENSDGPTDKDIGSEVHNIRDGERMSSCEFNTVNSPNKAS